MRSFTILMRDIYLSTLGVDDEMDATGRTTDNYFFLSVTFFALFFLSLLSIFTCKSSSFPSATENYSVFLTALTARFSPRLFDRTSALTSKGIDRLFIKKSLYTYVFTSLPGEDT